MTVSLILLLTAFAQHTAPDKPVPPGLHDSLVTAVARWVECEKAENRRCLAQIRSEPSGGQAQADWLADLKRNGSFFGKRLVRHRIVSVHAFGHPGDDEQTHVMIFGCAKLRWHRKGYSTLVEAKREDREWRLAGLFAQMQGIDAPPQRCAF